MTDLQRVLQSLGGTVACFVGGFVAALLLLLRFQSGDYIEQAMSLEETAMGAAVGAFAGAVVESFNLGQWDNLPIVLAAGLAAHVQLYQEVPLEPKLEL